MSEYTHEYDLLMEPFEKVTRSDIVWISGYVSRHKELAFFKSIRGMFITKKECYLITNISFQQFIVGFVISTWYLILSYQRGILF